MIAGGMLIDYVSRGNGARKRIATILDSTPDIQDETNEKTDTLEGAVEFKHLSFSYPDAETEILHDISFSVKPGMRVGIIGKTGSGKSTLVSLLPKLYNLKRGTLFIDGKDIMDWRKKDLRNHIGYVLQEAFLFSGTIRDNICFSEDDVRPMGRLAGGVRAITLEKDDEVVAMELAEKNEELLVVTQAGFGKRTPVKDYKIQARGGKGLLTYDKGKFGKTGELIGAMVVNDNDEVLLINSDGIIIRIKASEVSRLGRATQGVKIMKVEEDANIIAMAKVIREDEIEDADEEEQTETKTEDSQIGMNIE